MTDTHVDDMLAWHKAIAVADSVYGHLEEESRKRFDIHIHRIMQLKEELYGIARGAGSPHICARCGGQCCMNGKYHVSMLDLLAYQSAGVAPLIPAFDAAPLCPYGDASGCRMPPRFRAMTCLIFNCDLVEDRMSAVDREHFTRTEKLLREAILDAGILIRKNAGRAALLACGET